MYMGDHWVVTRQLSSVGQKAGWAVRTWAASAGYGLIPETAQIHPYSATFSTGHADSVTSSERGQRSEEARSWWAALARAVGPDRKASRSVLEIARAEPEATIIVAASQRYVAAMEDDLTSAQRALSLPERLILLTATPGPRSEPLKASWVRVEAALTAHVGGAMGALHARVARALVEALEPEDLTAPNAQVYVEKLAQNRSSVRQFSRTPMSDDQVKSFVRRALKADERATHSRLLRQLRDGGRACEQGRFRDLFQQMKKEEL
jgi:hypothetical protein